ncbi:hypothetical protein NC651_019933 [Populus alba x Populus x berolinensis]|nr:hypothetical protein NC651_019933 [Populus alba x Populus x berolinensis]
MAWKQNPIGKKKGRGEELESGRGRSLGFGIFRQCIYFTWSGIVYSIAPSGLGFTSTHVLLENGSGYMCKSNRGKTFELRTSILEGQLLHRFTLSKFVAEAFANAEYIKGICTREAVYMFSASGGTQFFSSISFLTFDKFSLSLERIVYILTHYLQKDVLVLGKSSVTFCCTVHSNEKMEKKRDGRLDPLNIIKDPASSFEELDDRGG